MNRLPLTARPAGKALEAHYLQVRDLYRRKPFADDPGRGDRLTAEAAGLYLDDSKNRITDETVALLLGLAEKTCESKAEPTLGHDSSTNGLIRRYRKSKEG